MCNLPLAQVLEATCEITGNQMKIDGRNYKRKNLIRLGPAGSAAHTWRQGKTKDKHHILVLFHPVGDCSGHCRGRHRRLEGPFGSFWPALCMSQGAGQLHRALVTQSSSGPRSGTLSCSSRDKGRSFCATALTCSYSAVISAVIYC